MALYGLATLGERFDSGFENADSAGVDLKKVLTELRGLKVSGRAGMAADASAALSGVSAGRGDTPLACLSLGTAGSVSTLTLASVTFVADRVKVADTATSNRSLAVLWAQKS